MQDKMSENLIDSRLLDGLLSSHDGDMALLYLYSLRYGGIDAEDAALQLCRTRAEIDAAAEKLERLQGHALSSVVREKKKAKTSAKPAPPEPADELPQYTVDELSRRTENDPVFESLRSECTKVIGHILSTEDLKRLFGIYDFLGLPPEVIMELLNYLADVFNEKYGEGQRRPFMRAIEKEAFRWAKMEILTFEQAEDYIRIQKERRCLMGKLMTLMGIKDRVLSKSETKYLYSWIEMGFGEDAIAIAYDRTVTSTGKLTWSYMNKIICNWHNANIHSVEEINIRDGRHKKGLVSPISQPSVPDIDMEALKNAINKI